LSSPVASSPSSPAARPGPCAIARPRSSTRPPRPRLQLALLYRLHAVHAVALRVLDVCLHSVHAVALRVLDVRLGHARPSRCCSATSPKHSPPAADRNSVRGPRSRPLTIPSALAPAKLLHTCPPSRCTPGRCEARTDPSEDLATSASSGCALTASGLLFAAVRCCRPLVPLLSRRPSSSWSSYRSIRTTAHSGPPLRRPLLHIEATGRFRFTFQPTAVAVPELRLRPPCAVVSPPG
jgi:hypothetical protein